MKKKKNSMPSKLEIALMYNLCMFSDSDGWKTKAQIEDTDKKFKGVKITDTPGSEILKRYNQFLDKNQIIDPKDSPLNFSANLGNLHNISEKLEKRGIIEDDNKKFLDKKKRERYKKAWRLKKNMATIWTLWNVAGEYDKKRMSTFPGTVCLQEYFLQSDFYKKMPKQLKKQWLNKQKNVISEAFKEDKKKMIVEYMKYFGYAEILKDRLEDFYNIDTKKLRKKVIENILLNHKKV